MKKYGLIGYPLSHSFSKKYFEDKFAKEAITGCSYELFPIESIQALPALLNSEPELCGLNVTIPYKESVIPFLSDLDAAAKEIGAVNCIDIRNKKLTGYNTDVIGFEVSLKKFLSAKINQAFVLGTGGSSKAVRYALNKMGIPLHIVSRESGDGHITYQDIAEKMQSSNLFINCTPLGMFPEVDTAPPMPYDKITGADFLFDLVYNPEETLFLKKGKEAGAKTKNGLEMLELQAEESWRIWNQ